MTTRTNGDLSRVTVVTPTRWADVALPADIPLVDVIPALVEHVGDEDLVDRPVVLQRLGGPPLDEESSAAALGVVDGETLYLRPVANRLPPVEFDDLVDGVAVGIRERPTRWKPQLTKALFLGLAAVSVATAMVVLSLPGLSLPRASFAMLLALVLVLVGAFLSRGGDTAAAAVTVCAAQPMAALSGLALGATSGGPRLGGLSFAAGNVLLAAMALLVTALLTWCLVKKLGPLCAATALVAVLAGFSAVLVLTEWTAASVAGAILLTVAFLLGQFLPRIAYPLARLRVPPMPTGPADLDSGVDPLPGAPLLTRAALTDRYFTALTCAMSVVAAGAAAVAGGLRGWAGVTLILVCGTALCLRARVLKGRGQRIATTVAGIVCFQVPVIAVAAAHPGDRVWLLGVLVALALFALWGARALPKGRLSPQFSWGADVLETLTTISILPILFQVLGLYAYVGTLVR